MVIIQISSPYIFEFIPKLFIVQHVYHVQKDINIKNVGLEQHLKYDMRQSLNPWTPGNARVVRTVATDALVLKQQAISIHSAD